MAGRVQDLFSTVQEIKSRTEAMRDELMQAISTLVAGQTRNEARLEALNDSVNVEGREPIGTRVALLEAQLVDMRRRTDDLRERRWQVWLAIVSSLLMPILVGVVLWAMQGK